MGKGPLLPRRHSLGYFVTSPRHRVGRSRGPPCPPDPAIPGLRPTPRPKGDRNPPRGRSPPVGTARLPFSYIYHVRRRNPARGQNKLKGTRGAGRSIREAVRSARTRRRMSRKSRERKPDAGDISPGRIRAPPAVSRLDLRRNRPPIPRSGKARTPGTNDRNGSPSFQFSFPSRNGPAPFGKSRGPPNFPGARPVAPPPERLL